MTGTPLVVLDACVLASFSLCDTLLRLAESRGQQPTIVQNGSESPPAASSREESMLFWRLELSRPTEPRRAQVFGGPTPPSQNLGG
jgi:hypothetical protein